VTSATPLQRRMAAAAPHTTMVLAALAVLAALVAFAGRAHSG